MPFQRASFPGSGTSRVTGRFPVSVSMGEKPRALVSPFPVRVQSQRENIRNLGAEIAPSENVRSPNHGKGSSSRTKSGYAQVLSGGKGP